jgi:hypothetical protein
LAYAPSEKLAIHLYILNGYNLYEDNNRKKSLGLYVSYNLGDKGSFGYANYIGDDTPSAADSISHLRVFQTVFFNYEWKKFKFQAGFDFGVQQHADLASPNKTGYMSSGLLTLKYQAKKKWAVYGRGEFFNDPNGFMAGTFRNLVHTSTGPVLWGATGGLEYKPSENSYLRLESRGLVMEKNQDIYRTNGTNVNYRMECMLNMGITF